MGRTHWAACCWLLVACVTASAEKYSQLWGQSGKLWQPTGRLPDYSYAGYKAGTRLPPSPAQLPATVDVSSYGADTLGTEDSTPSILAAINSAECRAADQCVVFFPPGVYSLASNLTIRRPVIIRGAGRDQTTLYFRRSWSQITGIRTPRRWSFGPGLLQFAGREVTVDTGRQSTLLARLPRGAIRGSRQLVVSDTTPFEAGQWVRLTASDPGRTGVSPGPQTTPLLYYLYGPLVTRVDTTGLVGVQNSKNVINLVAQVTEMWPTFIVLDRPMPVTLSPKWRDVGVHQVTATGVEGKVMGIEDMTVEMQAAPYRGHFQEDGFNGVAFSNAFDCFARNLRVKNADSSMGCAACNHCTFMKVLIEADRKPKEGVYGHHGVTLSRGSYNLVTDFVVVAPQVHDLGLDHWVAMSVYRYGSGTNLNLDFHKSAPFANLYTNLLLGKGARPFASGGAPDKGAHAALWNTIWNVRAAGGQKLGLPCARGPGKKKDCGGFGYQLNLVGTNAGVPASAVPEGWWLEDIPNAQLAPQDLYIAQLQQRLGQVPYATGPPLTIGVARPVVATTTSSSSVRRAVTLSRSSRGQVAAAVPRPRAAAGAPTWRRRSVAPASVPAQSPPSSSIWSEFMGGLFGR